MEKFVLIVHIFLALGMITLILLQQGKGADAGATFGGGASGTVFGASGTGNFMTKSTAIFATLFFITSLTLAIFAKNNAKNAFSLGDAPVVATPAPVTPAPVTSTPAPVASTPATSTAPTPAQ